MRKCTTVLEISLFSKPGWFVCMVCCCAVQSWQIRPGITIPTVVVSCVEHGPALPSAGLCIQINLVLAGSEDTLSYFHYMQQIPPNYGSLKVNILGLSVLFCCVMSFRLNFWELFSSELWGPESGSYLFEVLWIWKCGIKVTMQYNETHGWLIRGRRAGDVSYS